jgi:hypothetical protein
LIVLTAITESLIGQDYDLVHKFHYRMKVIALDDNKTRGFLSDLNDTVLFMAMEPNLAHSKMLDKSYFKHFSYENIERVTIQRRSSISRGVWMGAVAGFVGGAIAGLVEGSDPDYYWYGFTGGQKAIIYGAFFGGLGCIVGGVIGALVHRTFVIRGSREKFQDMRSKFSADLH